MTTSKRALDLNERQLLARVVGSREPALVAFVQKLGQEPLKEEEREELRSVLADELCDRGLDDDDEPTVYGKALDDIIGKLMLY